MAREVFVTLGGEERRLMFGAARSAIEIEKRLGKAPFAVLHEDISPGRHEASFSTTALAFLLFVSIRHQVKGLKEETVLDWLDAAFLAGEAVTLCTRVGDAMLLSGVCGYFVDIEAKDEDKPAEEGDGDEGKAPAVKAAE
jgi:hypothetical protein